MKRVPGSNCKSLDQEEEPCNSNTSGLPTTPKKGNSVTNKPPSELSKPKASRPFKYKNDCNDKFMNKIRFNCPKFKPKRNDKMKSHAVKPRFIFDLTNTTQPILTSVTNPFGEIKKVIVPDVGLWWWNTKRDMAQDAERKKGRDSSTLWDVGMAGAQHLAKKHAMNRAIKEEFYRMRWASSILVRMGYDPYRIYNWGEKASGLRPIPEVQDFYELRAEHLQSKLYFLDPMFPANNRSLGLTGDNTFDVDRWRRPIELCNNPKLFVDGISRFDVRQGGLGNCWFLTVMATLTLHQKLFTQVVPLDQAFDENYCGMFHFRFWQYGRWVDIVVDDRLPVKANGSLAFVSSASSNEYWSCLLEKAYAKLYGCYGCIESGVTLEAMSDLTGGLCEYIAIDSCPGNIFEIMQKSFQRGSIMCGSMKPDPNIREATTPVGLIMGHGYSITNIYETTVNKPEGPKKLQMIRLRNPWGKFEWKGAWSDKSAEWKMITKAEKQKMGVHFEDDGEFWMTFEEFMSYFNSVELCHVCPDPMADQRKWEVSFHEGEWVKNVTAGGCRQTMFINPQFIIQLEPDADSEFKDTSTVIISLVQKSRRRHKQIGVVGHPIGFIVYHIPNPKNTPRPIPRKILRGLQPANITKNFTNNREVFLRLTLIPGSYCIIPCTFDAGQEGEFLLRVYSDWENNLTECDEDIEIIKKPEDDPQFKPMSLLDPKRRSRFSLPSLQHLGFPTKSRVSILNTPTTFDTPALEKYFEELARGFGEIDWDGVQKLLQWAMKDYSYYKGLSCDICRSFVALLDSNHSGKLTLDEFVVLYADVTYWIGAFEQYTDEKTHTISGFKLRDAIHAAGFTVNVHLLNLIMHRYGDDGSISFDNFLACIIRLRHVIETHKARLNRKKNENRFTLEQFIEDTIYS